MDDMVSGLVKQLMSLGDDVTIERMKDFLISPTKKGGVQLLLPGWFFDTMNKVIRNIDRDHIHASLTENYK